MLVDAQYDQDVFVNGLVTASYRMRDQQKDEGIDYEK